MSAFEDIQDKIKSGWANVTSELRKKVFGANNENIDLLVDTFYKLEPPQRNAVIGGGVALLGLIVFSFLALYFSQISALNRDLNRRFDALYEIKELKADYLREDKRFQGLSDALAGAGSVRIKPYFEKVANDQGVQITDISESRSPLSADNPLGAKFEEVKADVRLSKISIPRLLNFIIEIEKGEGFVRVQDIDIRAVGTKLFFEVTLKARGLAPKS
jgi:type II secretory pathway component PulM